MQPVALAEEGFTGKAEGLPEYSVLLEMAYKNRPDWKMCLLASGISEEQLRLSQSEYFPNIVLTANGGNQVTQYPTFQTDVNTWRVSGTGSWTLFDSLGRENRIKEAAENLHAQRSNVELMRNNIALEVRDAYLSLKSALDTVDATRQAVESAEESYKVAAASYNAGMGTNVDVLDAQTDLTQARTSLLQSLYDVEVAKAKINKTTGKVVM
jgi:outer membrane protein TolC